MPFGTVWQVHWPNGQSTGRWLQWSGFEPCPGPLCRVVGHVTTLTKLFFASLSGELNAREGR